MVRGGHTLPPPVGLEGDGGREGEGKGREGSGDALLFPTTHAFSLYQFPSVCKVAGRENWVQFSTRDSIRFCGGRSVRRKIVLESLTADINC